MSSSAEAKKFSSVTWVDFETKTVKNTELFEVKTKRNVRAPKVDQKKQQLAEVELRNDLRFAQHCLNEAIRKATKTSGLLPGDLESATYEEISKTIEMAGSLIFALEKV